LQVGNSAFTVGAPTPERPIAAGQATRAAAQVQVATPAHATPAAATPAGALAAAPAPDFAQAGVFSPPEGRPQRRRGPATRLWGPAVLCFATILATAVGLVAYFALR
jgi:hypothetical protein